MNFGMATLKTAAVAIALTAAAFANAGQELALGITPSPLSLPVDIARAKGFFAAEGVHVRVVDCFDGYAFLQKLFDRELDLGATTDFPLAIRSFERTDFAVLATMTRATGHVRLIGRKSAGITAPAQLAGKRIGVLAASSSQYYLDSYLYFHGIDPAKVRIVPLPMDRLRGALAAGQVDAIAAYLRHFGPALAELGTDGVLLPDIRVYTESYNLVASRRTLAERRDEIVKVLRALERAELYIAAHPDEARAMLLARTGFDSAALDSVFRTYSYRLTLDQSVVSSMEAIARWARSGGQVNRSARLPNVLEIVDAGPLGSAVPTAVAR